MKKLLFPLLLALSLLFTACTLPELPNDFFTTTTTGGGGGGGSGEQPTGPVYDDDATSYGFYYDQLSGNAKAVYRAIYKNARATSDIAFALQQAITITTPAGTENMDTVHAAAISSAVKSLIQPAMDALAYDHPDISWIAYGGDDGSSFSISAKNSTDADGNKIAEINALTFQMKFKAPLASADDITAFEAAMNAAVHAITDTVDAAAPRHEQLQLLQQALSTLVAYDKSGERAHEAAGALLDGRAVCDGYAKSFKILCDAMNIPCVIVAGTATQQDSVEPHAWNYVQLENGAYYAVDVTWNDDGEIALTDYFLVGANTLPSTGGNPFSASHTPDGKFSAGEYTPFSFPALSEEAYALPQE